MVKNAPETTKIAKHRAIIMGCLCACCLCTALKSVFVCLFTCLLSLTWAEHCSWQCSMMSNACRVSCRGSSCQILTHHNTKKKMQLHLTLYIYVSWLSQGIQKRIEKVPLRSQHSCISMHEHASGYHSTHLLSLFFIYFTETIWGVIFCCVYDILTIFVCPAENLQKAHKEKETKIRFRCLDLP